MKKLELREKADLLRQLAHPVRLLILEELFKGAKCVSASSCITTQSYCRLS